jgi:hypothetical protein
MLAMFGKQASQHTMTTTNIAAAHSSAIDAGQAQRLEETQGSSRKRAETREEP